MGPLMLFRPQLPSSPLPRRHLQGDRLRAPWVGLAACGQQWVSGSFLSSKTCSCELVLWVTQVADQLLSLPSSPPQCNPPLEVKDLFVDIQDGKILMALLEVLSGRNLVRMAQGVRKK